MFASNIGTTLVDNADGVQPGPTLLGDLVQYSWGLFDAINVAFYVG